MKIFRIFHYVISDDSGFRYPKLDLTGTRKQPKNESSFLNRGPAVGACNIFFIYNKKIFRETELKKNSISKWKIANFNKMKNFPSNWREFRIDISANVRILFFIGSLSTCFWSKISIISTFAKFTYGSKKIKVKLNGFLKKQGVEVWLPWSKIILTKECRLIVCHVQMLIWLQ